MIIAVPTRGALSRLRAEAPSLPKALRRIADCILQSPAEVIYQSVTELAENARAGEASVIRLCHVLNFKGFQDFKLALAADLAQTPGERPAELRSASGALDHALLHAQQALEETRKTLDVDELARAAGAILSAPRIEISGQGASGITGQDVAYKLLRLGLPAVAHDDPHRAAMAARILPPGGVALGVTRSGSTIDTVHFLKTAREAGAFTIALTLSRRSPIGQYADCVLNTASLESPTEGGSVTSKISQMIALDALVILLTLQRPRSEEYVRMTAEAVVEKIY